MTEIFRKDEIGELVPAIKQLWGYIAPDLLECCDVSSNEEVVELCLDANRLISIMQRIELDSLVYRKVREYGISAVHAELARHLDFY